jgi:5-methylcytosine-specific restriction endonuclease McrA
MPIRPENKARYPANWDEISLRIRQREGWHCKWCGAENGKPHPVTGAKVVLTVAHLYNPDPACVDDDNLAALCQKCHLAHDAKYHAENARKTRIRKKLERAHAAGQLDLRIDFNE